mmetsp:Transcript_29792/g.28958  ORF Transcript_29792/g.28958 Transcript_29792/m.28958 type:complete len:114 (+) Transcript_29792:1145-1486(+)
MLQHMRSDCNILIEDLNTIKKDLRDNTMEDEREEGGSDSESQSEQGRPGKPVVGYITMEEKKKLAKEMFKGNDKVFEEHMKEVGESFKRSKDMQREREKALKEMVLVSQQFRD